MKIKNKPALGALQSVRKTNDGQFLAFACLFFLSLFAVLYAFLSAFLFAAQKVSVVCHIPNIEGDTCLDEFPLPASVKLLVYATLPLPLDRLEGRTGALEAYIPERQVGNLRT